MKKRILIPLLIVGLVVLSLVVYESFVFWENRMLLSQKVSGLVNDVVCFFTGEDKLEGVSFDMNRDECFYTFQNAEGEDVAWLTISNDNLDNDTLVDSLGISYNGQQSSVLNDWIELYCYCDGKIFLATKDRFYVFPYRSYEPSQHEDCTEKLLLFFTEEEFAQQFPDYKSYEWSYGWGNKYERARAHHPQLTGE